MRVAPSSVFCGVESACARLISSAQWQDYSGRTCRVIMLPSEPLLESSECGLDLPVEQRDRVERPIALALVAVCLLFSLELGRDLSEVDVAELDVAARVALEALFEGSLVLGRDVGVECKAGCGVFRFAVRVKSLRGREDERFRRRQDGDGEDARMNRVCAASPSAASPDRVQARY